VVGGGNDFAVFVSEGVIGRTAAKFGKAKAGAKLHAFNSGDGKNCVCEHGFERIEEGLAHTCGQAANGTFKNTANAIARIACFGNGVLHRVFGGRVKHGKGHFGKGRDLRARIKREGAVSDACATQKMRADRDAACAEGGGAEATGGNDGAVKRPEK
jgi:hypothetical protein